jgi:hypothetical protein
MRTKIFIWVSLTLCVFFAAKSVNAQQQIIKKDTLATVFITSTANVNQSVTNAFNQAFKTATEPRWFVYDKSCMVKFMMNEQKNSALYDKKGYLIYHISTIDESYLPDETKEQITSNYPKSKILNVYCVNQNDRSIFVINLEYGKNIVFTRFEDDKLVEVDRFINATSTL